MSKHRRPKVVDGLDMTLHYIAADAVADSRRARRRHQRRARMQHILGSVIDVLALVVGVMCIAFLPFLSDIAHGVI